MNYRSYLPGMIRTRPTWQLAAGAVVLAFVVVLGARHFLTPTEDTAVAAQTGIAHVQVATIGDLASQAGPLIVVGSVKSKAQATILAQTSGEITSLSVSIGDRIGAGQVIGQFENASQRAAVTQAQGSYDAAKASLAKLTGTTVANVGVSSAQAATAAQNAASSLAIALRSAYAALDDAVHTKADTLISNPNGSTPKLLNFTIPDTQLVANIESQRLALNAAFDKARAASDIGSTADVEARTATMFSVAKQSGLFLEDMIAALNQAVPNNYFSATTIAGNQATLAAARTEVVSAVSALTSAKSAFDAAVSGAQTASNSASGTSDDIAAAEASLKSAQGTLDAARAALDKAIIRSPISGTIVSLPVTRGDFVSNFAQIAEVSNPGALYIEAQVTSSDAKTIGAGNAAVIEGSVSGVITSVAPAIDPSTGKILVKIGIVGSQASLTDGEAVTVSLGRNKSLSTKTAQTTAIPIVSLKVTPAGPVVFTVTASSTLAAQPVTLGTILGDRVIVSGIGSDTEIITDARGHSAGEVVIVATSTSL